MAGVMRKRMTPALPYFVEELHLSNSNPILIYGSVLLTASMSLAQPITAQVFSGNQSPGPIPITPAWWTQLGGSSLHTGSSQTPQTSGVHLSNPRWIATGDGSITLEFTPQSGVVADNERVYAVGLDQQFTQHLAAFDQNTGQLAWATEIPFSLLDSWSTPSIDTINNTIIFGSGFSMIALDRFTGNLQWTTTLSTPIVNASPCVTDDLGDADRVFITDYSFSSGANGSLICINIDPFSPSNQYAPGDIVWTIELPGDCSGNTPAYRDGVVYVSTADNGFGGSGHILAFDATATAAPSPIWDTPNPQPHGFYSAVTYADGYVYASSYNFAGLQRSANTIKLNASTGLVVWSVPTVRTDASPLVLPNGKILVSGGVPTSPTTLFTGSLPAIELIDDLGISAVVLWDSFEATHEDLNDSGTWDQGEPFLSLGGWGHHPITFISQRKTKLLVGTMTPPSGFNPFSHASDLHTIDLSKHPTDAGFILSSVPNTGTTPALVGNAIFSTSSTGLSAVTLHAVPQPIPLIERFRALVDGPNPTGAFKPSP